MTALIRRFELDQARAVNPAGGDPRDLGITSANIRMDASWSPYIQVTLGAAPPSAADLDAIDPRAGWRAQFRCRSFNANGTVLQSWSLDLGLRTRRRTFHAKTPSFTLDAATDEAKLQDFADGSAYNQSGFAAHATDFAIIALQDLGYSSTAMVYAPGYPDIVVEATDAVRMPEMNYWDYIAGLAEAAGALFYFDESNTPTWAAPTWTPTPGTTDIGGIIQVEDTISRDDPAWGNYAIVEYSGNDPVQYVSSNGSQMPRKAIVATRNRRKPANGNAATKIRTSAQARGRSLAVQSVADLSVRPNQSRHVAYQGQEWTGLVQSVSWDLPAGTMSVLLNIIES